MHGAEIFGADGNGVKGIKLIWEQKKGTQGDKKGIFFTVSYRKTTKKEAKNTVFFNVLPPLTYLTTLKFDSGDRNRTFDKFSFIFKDFSISFSNVCYLK